MSPTADSGESETAPQETPHTDAQGKRVQQFKVSNNYIILYIFLFFATFEQNRFTHMHIAHTHTHSVCYKSKEINSSYCIKNVVF